jgi:DNA polymerase-1
MNNGDHLFLVDGSGYIFRAYHALPPLTRKSDGLPVGAVSGFCNMLWKLLVDARNTEVGVTPTHFAVIFDYSSKTFRNDLYDQYKANRTAPPEDLIPQFGLIREATRAFALPCIEKEGFEADDLIATYARLATEAGGDVTIISSDKDLMQLVNDRVSLYDTMKDKQIGTPEVIEKWGVPPEKMIDLQSLTGDSTDNIPGIPGIGPKTAAQLLEEFGDLDTLLSRASEIKQNKRRENLIEFAEQARLSRELVTLKTDVPINVPLEELRLEPQDGPKLVSFLKAMEFTSLTRRVAEATGTEAGDVDAAAVKVETGAQAHGPDLDMGDAPGGTKGAATADGKPEASTPAALAQARASAAASARVDPSGHVAIRDGETLDAWLNAARETGLLGLSLMTSSSDAMQAEIVGVALATADNSKDASGSRIEAAYLPLGHGSGAGDLLGAGPMEGQLRHSDALARLKRPCSRIASVLKDGHAEPEIRLPGAPKRHGITMQAAFDDTMLMSYVAALDAGAAAGRAWTALSERWLGHKPIAYSRMSPAPARPPDLRQSIIDRATAYAAEDADVTLRLWQVLKPRLAAENMTARLRTAGAPLVPVLARMEGAASPSTGRSCRAFRASSPRSAAALEDEILRARRRELYHRLAQAARRHPVRQDGPARRHPRRRPGQWSTTAACSRTSRARACRWPRKIVDWRQLTKLKSTYTDALPGYIIPRPKRVHTSYAFAAHDRPAVLVRAEPAEHPDPHRGAQDPHGLYRRAGPQAVSADYSQIELRVLAHIADIPQLKQAFADGIDIHAMTASRDVRRAGRRHAVRSAPARQGDQFRHHLRHLGLRPRQPARHPRARPATTSRRYFERFPGIRTTWTSTKAFARRRLCRDDLRPPMRISPIQFLEPEVRAFVERAGDQRADPGLGRRHHPPRHDPHGSRRCRKRARSPHAAAGA